MGKYENFIALASSQKALFIGVAVLFAVFVIASFVFFFGKISRGWAKIGGFATLVVAVALFIFDYSMISGDAEANAMTSGENLNGVIDVEYEFVDLVNYEGPYVIDVDAEEEEITVDENGYLPDIGSMSDAMLAEKYAWVPNRVDLSMYSLSDRPRLRSSKLATGKGNPKKGFEIRDAVDYPMSFDTWWSMREYGLADDNAQLNIVPATGIDLNKLDEEFIRSYEAFCEQTEDEEELSVRTTLTTDFHQKMAVLHGYLQMAAEVPAFKYQTWIIEDALPDFEALFVPDEDGNVIGYRGCYESVPGHEGQFGYYQLNPKFRRYADLASVLLENSEYMGKRVWKSKVHWPLLVSAIDDERCTYREDDPKKQECLAAYIFLFQDKNADTTGLYGINAYDRRAELFEFAKRGTPDEPEIKPEPEKKGGGGGGSDTSVIQTSTSSTSNPNNPDPNNPDPNNPVVTTEAGKDSTQSSLVNGATNQGNGSNNPANGDGQVEDLVAANAGKVDRVTQDAQQQQQQNSQQQQQQQAVNDANKDLASAGINQSVGNVDSGKVGQDTVTPVINTADQNDGYVENNQQNNDQQNNQQQNNDQQNNQQQNNQQQNNDQQNNQQQNNQQQNNNQQQPSGNTGKDQPAMGQVGKPQ